ncbi:ParA family protein [Achromobacter sp. SD115]|jgi:chromosome partitioning related protein ParA|uniref:ParA family protein n=2 Tax=Achromobacter TaxID=222 RepID=A0A0D6ISB8_ALCXX|nr:MULTISPECIES: ParA family protein [Achromobacter]ELQ7838740.1 ParA family protein [Pseudomonas aeruginosa]MBQ2648133.1 ParA family protein [Achromobacter sp.]AZS82060.1 ParA family protein [Achromobacter spanius]EJO30884.1 chromosome partitioning ATPase [Achromobacter marplatensis]MBC9907774.1 ParA family protein [Achromobacter xylosoxidans]
MPHVIAVASTKGGVTKTTTCANLAGIFADFGMQVLLFDADEQNSLTKYYPIEQRAEHGLTRVITRGGLVTEDCISKTAIPGIDIVCSDAVAGNLQTWLKDREDRLLIMRRAVRRSAAVEKYHAIIIDTQGAAGELQKTAAMAADVILSPIKPDVLSAAEFADGTLRMMESLNSLSDFGADFRSGDLYVVISALERNNNARHVADQIRRSFLGHRQVKGILETVVPHAAAYTAATTARIPVHQYDRRRGDKSPWDVMHRLAWELFPALNGIYVDGQGQPSDAGA